MDRVKKTAGDTQQLATTAVNNKIAERDQRQEKRLTTSKSKMI